MATINDLAVRLRIQLRDNGKTQETQAFPDEIDTTKTTPVLIPGSSPELQQFIQSAIAIYSRYRTLKKPCTLVLVPGQTDYDLPEDWITVDSESFARALHPSPVQDLNIYALPWVPTSIPMNVQLDQYGYEWYDESLKLVFKSAITIQQSITISFDYEAYHIANGTGTTIPRIQQDYVIIKAAEFALRALATEKGVALQRYKIGSKLGTEIDDSKVAEHLLKQAEGYEEQFRNEIIMRPYFTSGGDDSAPWD